MALDYFYPPTHAEKTLPDSSITSRLAKFHWCAGFDAEKKNNFHILSSSEVIFAIGTTYHIYNVQTTERQIFFSKDGGGIGAITVHPLRTYFAIGEKGENPNIYIYEFPSLKLYRILRKGTENSFSSLAWSGSGKMLASVGSQSDYTLTVWD